MVEDYFDVHHKVEEDLESSDQVDQPNQRVAVEEAVEHYRSSHADHSWGSRYDSAAEVAAPAAPGEGEVVAAVPAPAEV